MRHHRCAGFLLPLGIAACSGLAVEEPITGSAVQTAVGSTQDGGVSTTPSCDAAVTYASGPPTPMHTYPEYCGAPGTDAGPTAGVALTATSTAQVAAAMVGSWTECAGGLVGSIQFTAAGRFAYLVEQPDTAATAFLMTASTDPAQSGVFEVIDASATLGQGAYQVQLTYGNGGITVDQVVAFESPAELELFDNSAPQGSGSPEVLMPAFTTAYRDGVCGGPAGPAASFASGPDLLSALVGRWAWCSGIDNVRSAAIGFEFDADGTWYVLTEDETGLPVRGTASGDFGAYSLGDAGLDLATAGGGELLGTPVVSTCPRTLTLYAGTVNGVPQPQVFWPLP